MSLPQGWAARLRLRPPCRERRNAQWACPGLPGNDFQTPTSYAEAGGGGDATYKELQGGRERRKGEEGEEAAAVC